MKFSIRQVENGFIAVKNEYAAEETTRVFHNEEKRELLQHVCEVLGIGSDVIDWSDGQVESTGGTPSADKISEKDI